MKIVDGENMDFLKLLRNFLILGLFFFLGYFLSAIRSSDDVKKKIYSIAISSFANSTTMSLMYLNGQGVEGNNELLSRCMFVSYYNDFNDFINWMEKDSPLFWGRTRYMEPVESYRRVAIKEFGTENLKDFYNKNCFPLLGFENN